MSKEVTVKEEDDLMFVEEGNTELAAMMGVTAGDEEHLSSEDFQIPMLKIAQKGSAQVDSDQPDYIEGLKPGMFFNSSTGTVFGEELKVMALSYFRNFVIWEGAKGQGLYKGTLSTEEFEQMERELQVSGNPLVRDGGDFIHKGAGEEGKDLRYTDTRNYAVMLPDYLEEGMLVYPMSSTGIKPSKQWNSLNSIRRMNGQKVVRHATVWELVTGGFTKDNYAWKQVKTIKALGWASKKLFEIAAGFVEMAKDLKGSEALKYSEDSGSSAVNDMQESDF